MVTSATSNAPSLMKKVSAKAALINVDEQTANVFADSFRQFGIEPSVLSGDVVERLQREKFDAGVIILNDAAGPVLEMIRNSRSNQRMVVFGIGESLGGAVKFSRYGLNVVLAPPIDKATALRSVRGTHLLIAHEFRRYVRIPVVVPVNIAAGTEHVTGNTMEISGGGMSLRYQGKLKLYDDVQVTFDLPGKSGLKARGIVSWLNEPKQTAGLRFDAADERRSAVKKWIDEYLEGI